MYSILLLLLIAVLPGKLINSDDFGGFILLGINLITLYVAYKLAHHKVYGDKISMQKKHNRNKVTIRKDDIEKYQCAKYIVDKLSDTCNGGRSQLLEPIKDYVHTITSDNGKEFAYHKEVANRLDAGFYFAKPYQSWQRGLNEHTNGLIRQYFPKKTSFDTITDKQIVEVQNKLNNRPRKVLGYKTPAEVFFATMTQTYSATDPAVALSG